MFEQPYQCIAPHASTFWSDKRSPTAVASGTAHLPMLPRHAALTLACWWEAGARTHRHAASPGHSSASCSTLQHPMRPHYHHAGPMCKLWSARVWQGCLAAPAHPCFSHAAQSSSLLHPTACDGAVHHAHESSSLTKHHFRQRNSTAVRFACCLCTAYLRRRTEPRCLM